MPRPPKPKYPVTNWPEYHSALRQRGDVTVWISAEAVTGWLKTDRPLAGGKPIYSDLAIETVLTIRSVFHLPLRQAEGFVVSLFRLMGIDLPLRHHTTLSRRGSALEVTLPAVSTGRPVEIMVDSTGLRLAGLRKKHRGSNRTADPGGRGHDTAALPDVLDRMDGQIGMFLGDGAYGGQPTYDLLINWRQGLPLPRVIAPPTSPEQVRPDKLDILRQRDRHIAHIHEHGRLGWEANTGYSRGSLVESRISRYKRIIGRRFRTRSLPSQQAEAAVAANALNRMFDLGRPIIGRVG